MRTDKEKKELDKKMRELVKKGVSVNAAMAMVLKSTKKPKGS